MSVYTHCVKHLTYIWGSENAHFKIALKVSTYSTRGCDAEPEEPTKGSEVKFSCWAEDYCFFREGSQTRKPEKEVTATAVLRPNTQGYLLGLNVIYRHFLQQH